MSCELPALVLLAGSPSNLFERLLWRVVGVLSRSRLPESTAKELLAVHSGAASFFDFGDVGGGGFAWFVSGVDRFLWRV